MWDKALYAMLASRAYSFVVGRVLGGFVLRECAHFLVCTDKGTSKLTNYSSVAVFVGDDHGRVEFVSWGKY